MESDARRVVLAKTLTDPMQVFTVVVRFNHIAARSEQGMEFRHVYDFFSEDQKSGQNS